MYYMKVIQISAIYGAGSVGKICKSIHDYITTMGVESWVLCGVSSEQKNERNIVKVATKIERIISHLCYLVTGIEFSWCFFSTKKTIKYINKINPDLIHLHCCNDYYINVHKLLRRCGKQKRKIIITQHCEQYYTGSCGNSINCNKWKQHGCDSKCHFFKNHIKGYPLIDKTKYMWKQMNKSFNKYIENDYIKIISCTPWLTLRASESIILKRFSNKETILNGADNNIFKYTTNTNISLDKNKKNIILFVVPRFNDNIKGAKNINKLANTFIDEQNIEIRIVGEVPNSFKFLPNIKPVGKIDNNVKLAQEYSNADVTIMLSEAECFPMVCVESLLCGTKVVAFKCGGPDNAFVEGLCSFVDWGDYNSMHDTINSVIKSKYNKINVANFSSSNYSSNIMAKKYLESYYMFASK